MTDPQTQTRQPLGQCIGASAFSVLGGSAA